MKLKATLLIVLYLTSLPLLAYVNVQSFQGKKVYDLAVDSLQLKEKNFEGTLFSLPELKGVDGYSAVLREPGAVELPVLRFEVLASSAQDIVVDARTLKADESVQVGNLKPAFESVLKVPGARFKIPKALRIPTVPEYSVEEIGSVHGMKKFLVTLFPVEATRGSLMIKRSYAVEVHETKTEKMNRPGSMVFLVGAKFKQSAALAKYIQFRISQGMEVDQIDVAHGMKPEEIRAALRKLYSQKPQLRSVVIVGDADDVPGQPSTIISGTTDHYYACVDKADYASDILTPDLQVGRVSARDEKELSVIFDKYTKYIKGTFSSLSWVNRASFIATDDRYEIAEGSHNYVIDTYTSKKGYSGIFPAENQQGGDKLYAITNHASSQNVMDSLQKGRSIVNYSGHGGDTYWVGPAIHQSDVRSLKFSSFPFVISNACDTGNFTVDEAFAETWQRHEFGAIVFWGSMDSTYWDEDDILERRAFDGIFSKGLQTFGDITSYGQAELTKHYGGKEKSAYYQETYHLFGDPSISLRL